ncbi:MAG: 7-cyano-7-deazaguanine synthase QueC [Deltaproteobacteria bacterium]|nr:7-cyano-7-deazaguanine synthase QueC [Deltaproteobacteria bacterium]
MKKAIVLLSGGLDSATCLAIAKAEGFATYAMTFAYGQRHTQELEAARRVAVALGTEDQFLVEFDLRRIGGSALTADIAVPKAGSADEIGKEIPVTYVPARNTIFLSFALSWAEVLGAGDIFIGVNALDYSGYPDCRPEFLEAFQNVANLGTKAGVEGARFRIRAPLLGLTKAEIIRKGVALGVDYGLTHSCYDPDAEGLACGACDSCVLRRRGFEEAGVPDPTRYRGAPEA